MKALPAFASLVVALFLLVAGAAAATLQVQDAVLKAPGATVTVPVVLDTSAAGIAGYDITISLDNPSVATITGVSFPAWAMLNESTPLPASSVRLRTVDLDEQADPGATGVSFGTITLRGDAAGSTAVGVTITTITDDGGDTVSPGIRPGTFIVGAAGSQPVIANHTSTNLSHIPKAALDQARSNLHIAYGHTSHGSQIMTGMDGLVAFPNAPYGGSTYLWNEGGTGGALDVDDYFAGGDLGNPDFTTWAGLTREYLNDTANSDVNVVMWSWCGEASYASLADITTYLTLMNQLETEYPDVTFVYMTGHLDGSGEAGNLNQRNMQIRNYVRANNKVLYDFADIESYDPDGNTNYMLLNADDNCTYNNDPDYNWAVEWQDAHVEDVDWYDCGAAHSQSLNANQKAYAAWWLWARLGGWDGVFVEPATGDQVGVYRPSIQKFILKNGTKRTVIPWGLGTDTPVSGDWNGDGMGDVGVYRPSLRNFILKNGTEKTLVPWGLGTDMPISGDWNGDGMADVGVYRSSIQNFILKNGTEKTVVSWGLGTDVPVSGDWNGDGMGDVGVYRPSIQKFILKNGTERTVVPWGLSADIPVSGDWNGDGMGDVGVYRPSIQKFILKNGTEKTVVSWGLGSDIPVTGKWTGI